LLVAVKADNADPSSKDLLSFFDGKIAAWQKPDDVVFVEALPRNATGKVLKNKLHEEFGKALSKSQSQTG
jgi:acyl-CoA synthetase (AMP-forming)/AMP-acid ligase II